MRCTFDQDIHIHSKISLCSNDDGQTAEFLLSYAKANNLNTICVTDHFWDESVDGASDWYKRQNFEHINAIKPLPADDEVRFLFGCETEMDKNNVIGISKEMFDEFDFVIVPINHFHMRGFTISEENCVSPQTRANALLEKFNALLSMDLPFRKMGVAHLACSLMAPEREEYLEVLQSLDEEDLRKVFTLAAEKGIGIEINSDDFNFQSDEEVDIIIRPFKIAKECGCKFYFGSDSHHPEYFDIVNEIFENAIDLLDLQESDKFII